jgi:hypothetical protein
MQQQLVKASADIGSSSEDNKNDACEDDEDDVEVERDETNGEFRY